MKFIAWFEAVLMGMQKAMMQIAVAAADAFGERNPANVQVMPKDRFADFGPDRP